jgi:DNA polymerase elongation subunit (family B)
MEFRKCFIDTEMFQEPGVIPLPELANRPVICATIYDSYSKKYATIIWRKDFTPHIEKETENKMVAYLNSEESFFKLLWKLLAKMSPDFYTGYNIWFDINYLVNRSNKLKIPAYIKITGEKHIYGALVLDFKQAYKNIYTQTRYDLDHILDIEGFGAKQTDVNKIPQYYENDVKSLIKHNRDEDVQGLIWLDEKYYLTDLYLMIKSEIAGFNDLDDNVYQFSQILDQILLRIARIENEVMPSKPKEGYKPYAGAVILEPQIGIHKNVAVLDQEKFYPSIYKTYYTMLCNKQNLSEEEQIMKQVLKYIVKIYDYLLKYRLMIEKQMNKYTPGTKEYSKLENQKQKIKDLTNSVYGFAGYFKSRIKNYTVAEMITEAGRKIIMWDIKQIQIRGYTPIYSDTDSVFVALKTKELEKEALALANEISSTLSEFIKQEYSMDIPSQKLALGVDKIFSSVVFVEDIKSKKKIKKRYGGIICWKNYYLEKPYLFIRGFEFVRRDQSELTKQIQGKIIELVNLGDAESIKKIIHQAVSDIKNDKYDIDNIAINKTVQKRFEDYKVETDFLKGVRWANKYLNANITAGSMIREIFIKEVSGYPKTNVICYTSKQQLPLKNIVLDKDKMISRTLRGPLQNIIKLVGLSFNECLGQKSLLQIGGKNQ